MQEPNPEQLEEKLFRNKDKISEQDISEAKKLLSDEQKQKLQGILNDRESMNKLLSTPVAKKLMDLLNNKK